MARKRGLRAFGRWLERKRLDRDMTAPQVARILTEKHGIKVDSSTLYNYEGGTVFAPDPGVLYGLSLVYELDLQTMMSLLLMNRGKPAAETLTVPETQQIHVHPDDVPFIELGRRVSGWSRKWVLDDLRRAVEREEERAQRLHSSLEANRRVANE
jgi:hypothetical protein